MTQKNTLRYAAELLESGLRLYNHSDCTNDLNARRVGAVLCDQKSYKLATGCYRVFNYDKVVGTYKTAIGAARKMSEMNYRCTSFLAQHHYTDDYTFLTGYPVFKD